MLGKTHMMVGIAATLAITHPDTLSGFVTAAGIGAIGALISDIDVGTSSSHRDANRVIFLTIAVAVIFLAVDYFGKFGLVQTILQNSSIVRILLGVALFLVVCAFGKETPHRSFMHSFTALAALDAALCLIYPSIAVYFTIGFLSPPCDGYFQQEKSPPFVSDERRRMPESLSRLRHCQYSVFHCRLCGYGFGNDPAVGADRREFYSVRNNFKKTLNKACAVLP